MIDVSDSAGEGVGRFCNLPLNPRRGRFQNRLGMGLFVILSAGKPDFTNLLQRPGL